MGIDQTQVVSSPISTAYINSPGKKATPSRQERLVSLIGEEKVKIAARSQSEFIKLQEVNDKVNLVAKNQRIFQKQFQQIDNSIEQMKAQLERIIKQFPPYPPGSEERIRALRAYAGCRRLIDQLTIPPPDKLLP